MNVKKDDWEKEFEEWRKEKERKLAKPAESDEIYLAQIKDGVESEENKIEKPTKKDFEEVENAREPAEKKLKHAKAPKHIKALKLIALLIPLILCGYLVYANFIVSQEFEYFYDIGSSGEKYLVPVTRVSESIDGSYREMNGGLVYFDVPIARNAERVEVRIRFKDNFPEGGTMSLGAKDQEVWHYKYNSIYSSELDNLSEFENLGDVYLINKELPLVSLDELKNVENVVVATDEEYNSLPNVVTDYEKRLTEINTSLRGGHVFYVYADSDLSVNVKKQDLNWYEGKDELEIGLYDLNGNLIENYTIPDDGVETVDKKAAKIQDGEFTAYGLEEGVYKLEFSDADCLIREIETNTNKIIAERVFLADNEVYGIDNKVSKLYFESSSAGQLRLMTYHPAGIQEIDYSIDDGETKKFNVYQEDVPIYMDLGEGNYELTLPENDVLVSGAGYFAFSEENYFEPFKQKVVNLQDDMGKIRNSADYVVTKYKKPVDDSGWMVAETEFNLEEDRLFVKDNKLSFVFNIPHLSQEGYEENTIPIDWIEIKVYKPGVNS